MGRSVAARSVGPARAPRVGPGSLQRASPADANAATSASLVATHPKNVRTFMSDASCSRGGPACIVASEMSSGQYSRK